MNQASGLIKIAVPPLVLVVWLIAALVHEHLCSPDRLTPSIEFRQGDMLDLDTPDEAWAGITAFYSLIHIRRSDLGKALGELWRVLRPGGLLLAAFHIGKETIHLDEWWGHTVCVDFFFFRPDEMASYLREAGFEIEEIFEREPYPEIEHQSRRAYIFARRPDEKA